MSEVTRKIRITHVVEYTIKAKDDPGTPANFMGPGLEPRSADDIIDNVIESIKFQAKRGDNPTATTALLGGHYAMRQDGLYGNRTTTIEVDGMTVAHVEAPK